MSTRSYIGYSEGGDVRYVYHHYDGYPTGVGKELVKNYNSLEQAKELVNGGDISHCFKDQGGPLHYATRSTWDDSRGGQNEAWEDVKPKDPYGVDGYAEALEENQMICYAYLFMKGEWYVCKNERRCCDWYSLETKVFAESQPDEFWEPASQKLAS